MMHDDELDPRVQRRFGELDRVTPPDTWASATRREPSHDVPGRSPWRPLLYVAAAIAVIGGLVLATSRDADQQAAAPRSAEVTDTFLPISLVTTTTSPYATTATTQFSSVTVNPTNVDAASSSTTTTLTQIVSPDTTEVPDPADMASAEPSTVRAEERVALQPGSVVQRNCNDIVGVYDFDNALIGQIIGGDQWYAATAGVPVTWPACLGASSDAPLEVVVPPLAEGGYRFCVSASVDYVGCPTVFVGA